MDSSTSVRVCKVYAVYMTEAAILLKAMKAAGHDRIDDIVALGYDRDAIYSHLATRLKLKGKDRVRAHFGKMKTKREVERAIALLEDVRMEMAEKLEKQKLKEERKRIAAEKRAEKLASKPKYLTAEQKRIAMRELRKLNAMSPLRRWLWIKWKRIYSYASTF